MQTKFILPCLLSTLFFLNSFSPSAQNRKTIETTTDILMFITPVAGFAGSLAIGDYQGTKQIIFSGAMNMAMTYALKYVIRKERPDHSDHHGSSSMPPPSAISTSDTVFIAGAAKSSISPVKSSIQLS